jgi:chaperonin GroES
MKVKIRPLQDRVLIKRSQAQVTVGGIILPDAAQEKPKRGEVIAVGPGKEDKEGKIIPMTLKIGDKVLFSSYSGTEFQPENEEEEYLIMSEEDVLAVVK